MMRVILICAGEATRWGDYLGFRKHLIPVFGERLIDRTVRLIQEVDSQAEIIIAAHPDFVEDYVSAGAYTFAADLNPDNHDADKFLSSKSWYSSLSDTVLVYGDVFFTKQAIRKILTTPAEDWLLFARFKDSSITGGRWPECWAFRFTAGFQQSFEDVGHHLVSLYNDRKIDRIGGWEFYSVLTAGDIDAPGKQAANGIEIDDWTEDFDYPEDFTRWAEQALIHGYGG